MHDRLNVGTEMVNVSRIPIIGGNWKMHHTRALARELLSSLRIALKKFDQIEIVICPSAPWLGDAVDALESSSILVGAQNVHSASEGAFTGEQSAAMLVGSVNYVLVGHSERRLVFGETDRQINEKLRSVIDAGLKPILAVGESENERESGETENVLKRQLLTAFDSIQMLPASMVIAYEPVWAIGTGMSATPETAQKAAVTVRNFVAERFDEITADSIRIQYGGSVNSTNASEFAEQPDIDGALVGGASLNADDFSAICEIFAHGR